MKRALDIAAWVLVAVFVVGLIASAVMGDPDHTPDCITCSDLGGGR